MSPNNGAVSSSILRITESNYIIDNYFVFIIMSNSTIDNDVNYGERACLDFLYFDITVTDFMQVEQAHAKQACPS